MPTARPSFAVEPTTTMTAAAGAVTAADSAYATATATASATAGAVATPAGKPVASTSRHGASRVRPTWPTLLAGLCLSAAAQAQPVYIALGDSITFGETDLAYIPSYGDRGYVAGYADTMAARNGGARPTVINLAIDGETAASFATGRGRTPPVVGRTDTPLALQNLNYQTQLVSQGQKLSQTIEAQRAGGNTIQAITMTLGFNELAALVALPTAEAVARLPQTLLDYRQSYSTVLTQVRTLAPEAELSLLGYFNPFPANPGNPAAPIFAAGGVKLNAVIRGLANDFGARFVDTAGAFVGREAAFTYLDEMPAGSSVGGRYGGVLPIGNVHPNVLGYSAIATQVSVVPEPPVWLLMALGSAALTLRRRC